MMCVLNGRNGSLFKAVFLQQALDGVQVSHIRGIMQTHVLTLLQRFVTKLLLKPFFQITA